MDKGGKVVATLKKMMAAVGPSAALAFAAWLLQLLEQRHAGAHTRYRQLVEAFRNGTEGKRGAVGKRDIGLRRKRARPVLCATHIGMSALFLLLLSLMVGTLEAVLKADWLKLFGAPANMLRLLLVIPAAILVIVHNMLARKTPKAELGELDECKSRQQAGSSRHVPERRRRERCRRERCSNMLLQQQGA